MSRICPPVRGTAIPRSRSFAAPRIPDSREQAEIRAFSGALDLARIAASGDVSDRGFGSVADAELAQDVLDVGLGRRVGDHQAGGDLRIARAFRDDGQE